MIECDADGTVLYKTYKLTISDAFGRNVQKKIYLTEVVLLTKSYNLQDFKDWLHWHIDIIGFDHCKVFDNESSVDIKTVCDSYGDKVDYELVEGWPDQYNLYNRYINNESLAWWVLPIDDDEFLYVSNNYKNKINDFIINNSFLSEKNIHKLCVGWRNLFPKEFQEERTKGIIENATAWSDEACKIWQSGNEPVKTLVWMGQRYEWADKDGLHKTHNPFTIGKNESSYTLNGEIIKNSKQAHPTKGTEDLILYHYQYKSNTEWVDKCKKGSPGNKEYTIRKQQQSKKYLELYNNTTIFKEDMRILKCLLQFPK